MKKVTTGNEALYPKIKDIDYKNLMGDQFKEYQDIVLGKKTDSDNHFSLRSSDLNGNTLYDFDVYKVYPKKKELYPGMKDSPVVVCGIVLKDTTKLTTSRITLKSAIDLNAQLDGATVTVPMSYYFITKVEPKTTK